MRKKELKSYVFPNFIARSYAVQNYNFAKKIISQKAKDLFKK